MEPPYTQAPLNLNNSEFRLVGLQPCGPTDTIKCRLTTHPLPPDCPSYIALSYMWDHESPPDTIELNGIPFPIGHRLWTFLNRMRLRKLFTTYWIDALCIDQSNVKERNHQVPMMKHFYSEAESVSIWLGEAEEGSLRAKAMKFAADWMSRGTTGLDSRWHLELQAQARGLYELCQDPYWNRAWIVQEVVLAKQATLCCGLWYVPYSLFRRLILFRDFRSSGFEFYKTPTYDLATYIVSGGALISPIYLCSNRQATVIHDKIYAVLGILEEDAPSIPVDYDMSLMDLWQAAWTHWCQVEKRSENIDYLKYAGNQLARALETEVSDEQVWSVIQTHFLPRTPPASMREALELPDAPNDAIYFEVEPTKQNRKGLSAMESKQSLQNSSLRKQSRVKQAQASIVSQINTAIDFLEWILTQSWPTKSPYIY